VVYAAAALAASFFMIALKALASPSVAARVVAMGREALRVMRDAGVGDDDKERLLQQASVAMMGAFASITLRTVLAVAVALLPLLALHAAGLVLMPAVAQALASWEGIALTSVAMTAVYFVTIRP
jgi:hypothetical protein